jgi:uncharacterized phage protein (TIGR02218 family)
VQAVQVSFGAQRLEYQAAHFGGIGSGGGYVIYQKTYSGLNPSHTYRITIQSSQAKAIDVRGVSVNTDGVCSPNLTGDIGVNLISGATFIVFQFGAFDIEVFDFVDDVWGPYLVEDLGTGGADALGCPVSFFQTSADADITYNAQLYTHLPIHRGNLKAVTGQGASKAELEVEVHRDNPVAQLLDAGGFPVAPVSVIIRRLHRADLADAALPWQGQIVRSSMQGNVVTLVLGAIDRLLQRKIPRTLIQKDCNNVLGDATCQVFLPAFAYQGTVTAISADGRTVTVDGAGAFAGTDTTYFVRGQLASPTCRRAYIVGQDGDAVVLQFPAEGLAVNDVVTLFPGCDKRPTTCENRFGNLANRRGFDLLQLRSPFIGAGLG